ncbi:MAG: DUF1835 domain-containing protein [Bacillaceae bacterium]
MKKVLHILNGQCMYDYFKENKLEEENEIIPFNEAMCAGDVTTEEIFSDEFIKQRCFTHNVTLEEYQKITLKPLEPLLSNKFDKIVLWFGEDMFCQMNMLTVLAYLDKRNFIGDLTIHLVDEKMDYLSVIDTIILMPEGYYNIYKQVIIEKSMVCVNSLPVLQKGINLYVQLLNEDNEIVRYIHKHKEKETKELVRELLQQFPKYGLGDTQYIQFIERCT